MKKNYVYLLNWGIHSSNTNNWHLTGDVYNHNRFTNGTTVTTSSIQNVVKTSDGFKICTRNTIYECSLASFNKDNILTLEQTEHILKNIN